MTQSFDPAGPRYLTGQLLLALPGIGDPNFEHAAILMCSHDEDGAMGIGIGRSVDGMTVADVMVGLGIDSDMAFDQPVLLGGPVEPQRGFILHSRDWGGQDSIDVAGQYALSSSLDILRAIAAGQGPSRWLMALGYAGWSAGQLEGEVIAHGWHAGPATDALLFDTPPDQRWSAAFAAQGVDARLLSVQGGRA